MTGLREFLLACVAEDEEAARAAAIGPWRVDYEEDDLQVLAGNNEVLFDNEGALPPGPEDWRHIVRWNPARVLAECGAKRRIIARHDEVVAELDAAQAQFDRAAKATAGDETALRAERLELRDRIRSLRGIRAGLRDALYALAAVYADRPGYRPEWAAWMG